MSANQSTRSVREENIPPEGYSAYQQFLLTSGLLSRTPGVNGVMNRTPNPPGANGRVPLAQIKALADTSRDIKRTEPPPEVRLRAKKAKKSTFKIYEDNPDRRQ